MNDGGTRALRGLVLALGALAVVSFAWVTVSRFVYPIDAEWMVGAMRDAVERVRDGKTLYVAPSTEFIPFIYPPLWYALSGLLARAVPTLIACKTVSLAATALTATSIFFVARRLGATRYWAAVGVLLHFGAYAMTLLFYDLERVDTLEAALVVAALPILLGGGAGRARDARDACAGALLGLAFFAKQPALFAFAAAGAGLVAARQLRRAALVVGAGALVLVAGYAWLQATTHGYFSFYCITLPRAHGIEPKVISSFFVIDLPKLFVLTTATIAIVAPMAWSFARTRSAGGASVDDVVFAFVLGASFVSAFFMRAHRGGWANVIICWTPLACAAVAVAASRAEARAKDTPAARMVSRLILAGCALQLLASTFDLNDYSPNASDLADRRRLEGLVARLEERGEVLVTPTGGLTHPRHLQVMALVDILRAGFPIPPDYLDAIRAQRFAALVVAGPKEADCDLAACTELGREIQRHYFYAARLPERTRSGMTGHDGRPRWVLRPRRAPLASDVSPAALDALTRAEMGLCLARRAALTGHAEIVPDDAIEDEAARAPKTLLEHEDDDEAVPGMPVTPPTKSLY